MARRSLPDADFFLPDAWRAARERRRVLDRARRGRVVHLTHEGCLDGAGSDVVVRLAHGDGEVSTVFTDPAEVAAKLALLAEAKLRGEGRSLLLSDVSPQGKDRAAIEAALGELNELGWRIEWRDHHAPQWSKETLDAVRHKADVVRVSLDNSECGTTLCQRDLLPRDAFARELGEVVRDIDLWIRKDPRSDTLTEARHGLGSEALVRKLVRDRVVLDAELERAARAHRAAFERDLARALARARVHEGPRRVAVVYGDFPGSQACAELRKATGSDVEIALKPDGKFSLRSREDLPICHLVARRFGGGGHPNASGGRLRVRAWEWPRYWATGSCADAARLVQHAGSQAAM